MIGIEGVVTRNPATLRETDTLGDALQLMTSMKIHHIPIVDDRHHVVGLVSHRDVLAAAQSTLRDDNDDTTENVPLSSFMTRNVKTAHESVSLRNAGTFIEDHGFGCLPVVDDGKLTGIITDSDFVRVALNLLEQLEYEEDSMVRDESPE